MIEEWRQVVGDPAYEVSSEGRVRRVKPGQGVSVVGRVLVPTRHTKGYLQVHISGRRKVTVHSLVAAAFLGPRPPGYEVNHRDGVKANNPVRNLEYVLSSENHRHAVALGLVATGGASPRALHSDEVVTLVRRLVASGARQGDVARRVGASPSWVSRVVRGIYRPSSATA